MSWRAIFEPSSQFGCRRDDDRSRARRVAQQGKLTCPSSLRDGARLWWRSDGDAHEARAAARQLARHRPDAVGSDPAAAHRALPRDPLRHARPRRVRRDAGRLHDRAAGARRAGGRRRRRGCAKFSFAGISIGGMVGQWLGANAGERLDKLVLSNTSSKLPGGHLGRAHRRGEQGRYGVDRRRRAGALVHRGVPREEAAAAGERAHDALRHRFAAATSAAARRFATWTRPRPCAAHSRADAGDRRHARSRDAEGAWRGARRSDPRRAARRACRSRTSR